jgi:SAM-dependent methyltransferase
LTASLTEAGYQAVGIDVSPGMLALARGRHPGSHFLQADICTWAPPEQYDLVIAWDSIFHVPHAEQRARIKGSGVVLRTIKAEQVASADARRHLGLSGFAAPPGGRRC